MNVARENPLPGFLSTTGGKIFAATIAAAVVGAGIAYAKNTAAAAAAPTGPVTTPGAIGSVASFLFNVAYPATATVTPAEATADLSAAGFTGIFLQPDPTLTDSFIVAASYGPSLAYSAQVQAAITTPPASGALAFSIAAPSLGAGGQAGIYNLQEIASLPTVTTVSLAVGQWYSFSVRTSFLQSATNAQGDVISILQGMGFGSSASPPAGVAPVTQSSAGVAIPTTTASGAPNTDAFDTWNVIAQYTGASGGGAGSATFTPGSSGPSVATVPDLPPLLMFVPGALPTAIAAPTGTPAPSNVMP